MKTWMLSAVFLCLSFLPAQGQVRMDLGGYWQRWIGTHFHDTVLVPSSYRPLGTVRLRRSFELPALAARHRGILRFEGVSTQGKVSVNGHEVGTAGWGRSEFDITAALSPGANQIGVEATDWQVPLGPNGAWEAYGGIIRDVFLEIRPDPYLENARLTYAADVATREVRCTLDAFVRSTADARATLTAELMRGGSVAARASQQIDVSAGESVRTLKWTVNRADLWSPDAPNLYELHVRLTSAGGEDVYSAETGFRDLRIEGDHFVLNGRRLVLKGVARHDLWKDQGFTLTGAQIEQDMRMIKALGANFVRLGVYPNDKRTVEWASRVGLLVSEESGLCWIQFRDAPRETVETGIQNLEGEIRRDWNSPSLFSVMFANESTAYPELLQEVRKRVKTLLPNLFLSATDLNGDDHTLKGAKRLYDEGGLDFYTSHVYGIAHGTDYFDNAAKEFPGRPLVFTEWGGRAIGQSPIIMRQQNAQIARLVEEGRLAGYWFWSWQDLPEFSRQDAEMVDGILLSGVVTEERRVRPEVWGALSDLFRHDFVGSDRPQQRDRTPQVLASAAALPPGSEFFAVPLQRSVDTPDQAAGWKELEGAMARYWSANEFTEDHWRETGGRFWTWNAPHLSIGAIPFETPVVDGATRPLVIRSRIEIPANLEADRLHFLGNVTVPDGYPTDGTLGRQIGTYVVAYADGERQEVPLRWGLEVARSNTIAVASRLDPEAALAHRVIEYPKDIRREVYQTLLLSVPTKRKPIASITITLDDRGPAAPPQAAKGRSTGSGYVAGEHLLLLYAITAERLPMPLRQFQSGVTQ
jgi:hypothetical protein